MWREKKKNLSMN